MLVKILNYDCDFSDGSTALACFKILAAFSLRVILWAAQLIGPKVANIKLDLEERKMDFLKYHDHS